MGSLALIRLSDPQSVSSRENEKRRFAACQVYIWRKVKVLGISQLFRPRAMLSYSAHSHWVICVVLPVPPPTKRGREQQRAPSPHPPIRKQRLHLQTRATFWTIFPLMTPYHLTDIVKLYDTALLFSHAAKMRIRSQFHWALVVVGGSSVPCFVQNQQKCMIK